MVGDGGYPKAWRHYVHVASFADADHHEQRIAEDIVLLAGQIELDEKARLAVDAAAMSVRSYLSSLSIFAPYADTQLKDAAIEAIDEMEAALKDAVGQFD